MRGENEDLAYDRYRDMNPEAHAELFDETAYAVFINSQAKPEMKEQTE